MKKEVISEMAAPPERAHEEEKLLPEGLPVLVYSMTQTTLVCMAFFSLRRRFGSRQQVKSALGHDPAVCQIKILR